MQRLSNAVLSLALTVFVTTVSLVLITAAWLMATQLLDGPGRFSLPKWLFTGAFVIGFGQVNAPSAAPDAYVVVDAYVKPTNSRLTNTAIDLKVGNNLANRSVYQVLNQLIIH